MGLLDPNDKDYSVSDDIDIEAYKKSERGKRYQIFLSIIERLEQNVNIEDICCGTREEIFDEIEKRRIDISDIIPANEYLNYKNIMLSDRVQTCPHIGRRREKVYDLSNIDDYKEFEKKCREERMKRWEKEKENRNGQKG